MPVYESSTSLNIVRGRRGIRRTALVCALLGVAAIVVSVKTAGTGDYLIYGVGPLASVVMLWSLGEFIAFRYAARQLGRSEQDREPVRLGEQNWFFRSDREADDPRLFN